jgi:prophage regulatory protein
MRQPEVLAVTGLRKSQLQEAVARGAFPRPVKILEGGRANGWVDSEVFTYIEHRIAARDAVEGGPAL